MSSNSAIFFRNADDVRSSVGIEGHTYRIALDIGALAELQLRNISATFALDLLNPEDIPQAWKDADLLRAVWSKPLGSDFDEIFGGLTLSDLFSYEAGYFGREAAISRILLKRAFERLKLDEIVLCQRPKAPGIWYFMPYLFEAVAVDMARSAKIKTHFAKRSNIEALRKDFDQGIRISRNAFWQIKRRFLPFTTPNPLPDQISFKDKRVLFVGNAVDIINGINLSELLHQRHQMDLTCISFGFHSNIAEQASRFGAAYYSLTQFGDYKKIDKLLLKRLARAEDYFLSGAADSAGDFPEIYENEVLRRTHFNHLFLERCMELALSRGAIIKMLDLFRPHIVVVGLDWHHIPRVLVNESKLRGIPTLCLSHAGLMDWSLFGFASDKLAIWGEGHQVRMNHMGHLTQVGSQRYDHLIADIEKNGLSQLRSSAKTFSASLGVDISKDTVLVLTASAGSSLLTQINPQRHLETLTHLLDLPSKLPDVELVFKPHPRYDYLELYTALAKRAKKGVKFLSPKVMLHKLLPVARAALLVNVPTDAALEAILYQIPTLYISYAWDDDFDNSFNRESERAYREMTINDLEDITPALKKVVKDGLERDRLKAINKAFLHHWIGGMNGKATERTADLVADSIRSDKH